MFRFGERWQPPFTQTLCQVPRSPQPPALGPCLPSPVTLQAQSMSLAPSSLQPSKVMLLMDEAAEVWPKIQGGGWQSWDCHAGLACSPLQGSGRPGFRPFACPEALAWPPGPWIMA